ncbi:MAG TPA: hypothetical protein VI298_05095 [Geobacteraceae bacterium]
MKKLLIGLALLLTAGCGPWLRTGGPCTMESQGFGVDLPDGWMRSNTGKFLLVTRDGVLLQKIAARRIDLAAEKQFTHTRKRVTSGMFPQEVAEVVLDDFQSDAGNLHLAVEENGPATVAGKQGFKVRLAYLTKGGLPYRCACYGFVSGNWLYLIFYNAPQRYYFDKDAAAFEGIVKSFRLTAS